MQLRPYQHEALESLDAYWEHGTRPLIVAPTGSGKSVLIAEFIRREMQLSPSFRAIVVTHSQELVAQNNARFVDIAPDIHSGIYCAGLDRHDTRSQVTFASIQSVYDKPHMWPPVDVLIVDEAHRIPNRENSQYQAFIAGLKAINPHMAVLGLTATPYRLDSGLLHEGENAMFDGIAYDTSIVSMVKAGYLAPLTSKGGANPIDLTNVRTRAGEFASRDLEQAADTPSVTNSAVTEIIRYGHDRKSWLVFASSISHAHSVAECFHFHGVDAAVLTSTTPAHERALTISRFRAGDIRCLVNVSMLTTGFDAPKVDLIALLTATQSCSKYVQMLGRGMRIHPGKRDCLILDYGGNVERFGAVECAQPRRRGGDGRQRTPYKTCPVCRGHMPTGTRLCPYCGHTFERPDPSLYAEASSAKAYQGFDFSQPTWVQVDDVLIERHRKPMRPDSIKLTFLTEIGTINHWLTLDHSAQMQRFGRRYIVKAGGQAQTVDEAMAERWRWNVPSHVLIQKKQGSRYFTVRNFRFDDEEGKVYNL